MAGLWRSRGKCAEHSNGLTGANALGYARLMSEERTKGYDPQAVEARRQAAWRGRDEFRTPPLRERPHLYIKPSAPFTSGNVHIGHVRSYSIGDAYARYRRARGDDVLFAFGFDAFGLPAELAAIAGGFPPSEWVARSAQNMTAQLNRLGFSFDWERAFFSSDPVMYRWSQWLFLVLLDAGLVYRGTGTVDWCDTCQTTLATIQVEDGLCWRCHQPVRLIEEPQWFLRMSAYVRENDERLSELENWDENSLASQRFVLGRVDGVELDLPVDENAGDAAALTVFTPHSDAVALARFVLLSPRHPDVERFADRENVRERLEQLRAGGLERSSRDADAIPLVDTGRALPAPAGADRLPVLISPVVDGRFGATAVLGIPELDRTDAVIAERVGIATAAAGDVDGAQTLRVQSRPAVRYRADDFSISRQRSWGTPIPIVYCEQCDTVPVPAQELPVLLPLDITPTGEGNPLAELDDFVKTTCPRCGGPARRETDTLDCHFDALWLWVPVCVPPEARGESLESILALPDLRHWLPCERVVAGSDSGNFVFDQRTVTKALRDIGPLAFLSDGEPFAGCTFHEMVISDGRKMSKHLGNVVDPDELVARFGADTLRLAVLYAANPQRALNWSESAVLRCHRFLTQVWDYTCSHTRARAKREGQSQAAQLQDGDLKQQDDGAIGGRDATEHLRARLAKWCQAAVDRVSEDMEGVQMHSAARNVMRLFDRIKDFEKRVRARTGEELGAADQAALLDALGLLCRLLAPMTPHIAEELWVELGNDPAAQTPWPGLSFQVAA
jgi:leucyl-tRNA synthetase